MSVTDIRMISMTNAAIFDLDRTLVLGSSAAVFQRHLADVGLGTEYSIPGMGAYQKSYEMLGENPLMMQVARLFVRSACPAGSTSGGGPQARPRYHVTSRVRPSFR